MLRGLILPKINYCPNCGTEMEQTKIRKKKKEKLIIESEKTSRKKAIIISAISIGALLVLAGSITPLALKLSYRGTIDILQLNLVSVAEPNDTFEVTMRIVGGKIKLDYIDLYSKEQPEIVLRSCHGIVLQENQIYTWSFENKDEYEITNGITIHFVMFMDSQWIKLFV